jgi:conjugative relaxase-like TrwC/TraI family protein
VVTIKAQTSPRNAARYFDEHLSRDDYFSEKQQTTGRWFGRGCETLGVESESVVEQEPFVALCQGLRPDDHSKLTQRATTNRRCLYDLTVSAPKSLSIMALVAGDARLIAAHEKAVAVTLAAAEELARVRVRKGAAVDTRQSRVTGNLIGAQFLHRESRALDPQLHTHCVIFNVTHDPVEQRLKALEPRQFYDQSKQLTQIYRDHLSQSLRELGYETYLDRQRCPQIRGVDKNLITTFSKRAAQRDALVALSEQQLGRSLSKTEVARVVHQNRAKKQQRIDPDALRKFQLEQLPPAGRLRLEKLKERAMTGPRQPVISSARTLPPVPGVTMPGVNWIAVVRLALLAARSVDINPHLFAPQLSFPQRVIQGGRYLQNFRRFQSFLRYAQKNQQKEFIR